MEVAGASIELVYGDRLAAHRAAQRLVARLAGVADAEVELVRRCPDCGGPHGRPVVLAPATARDIAVSLAHASPTASLVQAGSAATERPADRDTWHAVAAVRGRRIGVDLERDDAPAARLAAIRALLGESVDPLRAWTEAEAVLKADGRGLRVDPATLVRTETALGTTASVPGSSTSYALHPVPAPGLVVAVAIER